MYNETWGKIHFLISFVGFNILYFPMNLLVDMPRRIFTYQNLGDWPLLNGIASVGAFIFAGAQIILAANLLYTWFRGPPAPANPWNSQDLEWSSTAAGSSPALETSAQMPAGGWIGQLASATQSTGSPPVGATAARGPHLSSRPLQVSIGALIFLAGTPFYPQAVSFVAMVLGVIVVAYAVVGWARDDYGDKFHMPADGEGDRWPFGGVPKMKLGVWVFLSSEIVLFGSFLGAYIFMRAADPTWPSPASIHDIPLGTLNTIVLVSSGLTMVMAIDSIRNGDQKRLLTWLAATFVLGSVFMGIKFSEWSNLTTNGFVLTSSNPTIAVAASAYYVIVGLHGAHVVAGLLVMVYLMKKTMGGRYSKEHHEAIENFGLYWAFVDIVWCFVFVLFYLI
jgi:cytochrome c oxidase subunit I+III